MSACPRRRCARQSRRFRCGRGVTAAAMLRLRRELDGARRTKRPPGARGESGGFVSGHHVKKVGNPRGLSTFFTSAFACTGASKRPSQTTVSPLPCAQLKSVARGPVTSQGSQKTQAIFRRRKQKAQAIPCDLTSILAKYAATKRPCFRAELSSTAPKGVEGGSPAGVSFTT